MSDRRWLMVFAFVVSMACMTASNLLEKLLAASMVAGFFFVATASEKEHSTPVEKRPADV